MKPALHPVRLLARILLVVGLAQAAVMLALPAIAPGVARGKQALLGVALLLVLSGPAVYWLSMPRNAAPPPGSRRNGARAASVGSAVAMAVAAQVLGLMLTAGAVVWQQRSVAVAAQGRFDRDAERIEAEVRRHFAMPLYALNALRATFAVQRDVDRRAFRTWVEMHDLAVDFPGMRGLGLVERVARGDIAEFVAAQRRGGDPEFDVRVSGEAEQVYIVRYIEPLAANRAALGIDVGRDAVRREAIERALASGAPALSGRVTLAQDDRQGAGLLYLMRLSDGARETGAPIVRLLYAPVVIAELMQGVADVADEVLAIELFEGPSARRDKLLYDTWGIAGPVGGTMREQHRPTPAFETLRPFMIGGRMLALRITSTPASEASIDHARVAAVAVGGTAGSCLLALTVWLLAVGRVRAQRRAQRMTAELARLARVAQHTSDAVVITDARRRIEWVNAGFTRITGCTPDDAVGRTPEELLSGSRTCASMGSGLTEAASGGVCRIEAHHRTRDGREYWLDTEVQPLRDEQGVLIGYMEVSSDVTVQKETRLRLEAALRESEALLRTVRRHAVVSVTDPEGRITEANDAFCRVSGYELHELLGQDHRIVSSRLQPAAFWAEMWRTISGGSPWRGEICNRAKDGSLYWFDSMIAPFVGADGRIEKYIAIHTDISASKAVQRRLAETADRLTLAIEGGSDGLWDWLDTDADAEWWSPTFYAMLGLRPGEVTASRQTFASLLHPSHLAGWHRAVDDALAGRSAFDIEVPLRTASAEWRWFRLRAKVWRDAAGRATRMAGSMQDVHDRRQAERELARERQRLGHILDGTNVGTWEWNVETGETYFNERWAQIGGRTLAELGRTTARHLTEDMHEDDRLRSAVLLEQHFDGALEHYELETRIRHREGHWVWVLDRGKLCSRSDDGRPRWVAGTRMDITQRKLDEQALRDSEAFLDRAGRIAGVGGWSIDLKSGKVTWSAQTFRIHEVEPGHQPKLGEALSYYPPEARAVMEAAVQEAMARGRPWDLELPFVTAKGRAIWVHAVGEAEFDGGVPVRLVGAVQDVTERHVLDEKLRRSHELMAGILENLPCGLSVFDRDFRLVAHNTQYRRLLELPDSLFDSGEITFERIVRFNAERGEYGAGSIEEIVAPIVARTQEPVVEHVFERKRPDGVTLEVRGAPLPAGGLVTTYSDVTTRKKAELMLKDALDRAEQASVTKGQFLANVSHEIRTPMNAVLGMLTLLQKTALTAQQLDYVTKTEGAARSLLGLLNDILDFSKAEAGKMTLDPRPFAVERLLRDLSVILSANVGAKDIDVLFDVDPAVPDVLLGDDMRLQQVLTNLGGNAIKFTARGEVVLGLRVIERDEHDVLLEFAVRDSGIGIAPENQARIFTGFSQAESSTTRRFGGTGLGLAICQHLIALMGGNLGLESASGQGSRFHFRIRLPIGQTAHEAPPAPRPQVDALRTLVVDDNASARQVLVDMARSLGWEADSAAGGAEALAAAERSVAEGRPYQAVFLDWRMPEMDGWETGRRLLQTMQALRQPAPLLVMVTGHGLETLAQRSDLDQSLLNGFLVKPVTAAMMLDAVAAALGPGLHCELSSRPALRGGGRLAGLRLLVVEDNANNRQVAQELLGGEGAHVALAVDGQLGVEAVLAADPQFDAVLMDVQMPVMDGYQATARIREHAHLGELPIIAMTANAAASDREACLAVGMNDHVGKPFDLSDLVATLLRHCRRERAEATLAAPALAGDVPAGLVRQADHRGIDLAAALARMGGNGRVYLRTLESFRRDLGSVPARLRSHLEGGESSEAARLLHTVKGLAGTLGIRPLAALAAEAERRVTSGAASDTALLERLDALVAVTLDDVAQLAGALQNGAPSAAPAFDAGAVDLPGLRRSLEELASLLQGADMHALGVFERLQETHAAHLGAALRPLEEAMETLDFDQALAHCRSLRQGLDE